MAIHDGADETEPATFQEDDPQAKPATFQE